MTTISVAGSAHTDVATPEGAAEILSRDQVADLGRFGQSDSVRLAVSRTRLWAVLTGAGALLLLTEQPLALALVALSFSTTLAVALASPVSETGAGGRQRLSVVAAMPAGFMLLAASGLFLGLVAGSVGYPIWRDRLASLAALGVLALAAGAVCRRRGDGVELVGRDRPAAAGALLLGSFFVWVLASQPLALWSRMMSSGTDFLRHLKMIRDVQHAGMILPGEVAYPRALHAFAAWLASAMGLETDADSLWRGIQPLVLLMLVLLLLAVMASASRAAAWLLDGWAPPTAAAIVAGFAFVQTSWFSTFLDFGNVMNMLVAISLMSLLLTGLSTQMRGSSAALIAGGAVALSANSWQLLVPVAFLGSLPWAVLFLRRGLRDAPSWISWLAMAALTVNGLAGVRTTSVSGATSTSTLSNLFNPDWWWFVALALALGTCFLFIPRCTTWSLSATGLVAGVVLVTSYLFFASGSSWELMKYYPVKAMWTGMIVLIPLASTSAAVSLCFLWRRAAQAGGATRLAVRALVGSVVVLTIVGVIGRGASFRSHLGDIAAGEAGLPNWALAVIDTIDRDIPESQRKGAIVMGIVPSTTSAGVASGFVGMVDYMAMESLDHLGAHEAFDSPVKADLAQRNSENVCLFLKAYPGSIRVTGPNPAAGPGWLLDSGCPESVVQPERWISLQFDPEWLARSQWEDPDSWTYPTVAEVEAARQPSR